MKWRQNKGRDFRIAAQTRFCSDSCAVRLVCGHIMTWQDDVNVDMRISEASEDWKCVIFQWIIQCSVHYWRKFSCLGTVNKYLQDIINKQLCKVIFLAASMRKVCFQTLKDSVVIGRSDLSGQKTGDRKTNILYPLITHVGKQSGNHNSEQI